MRPGALAHPRDPRRDPGAVQLRFQEAELAYLRSMRFIKSDFVDFLGLFRLNEKYITVTALPSGEIDITIRGPWLHTILFEIPVLAIVNEVYFRNTHKLPDLVEGRRRLDVKISAAARRAAWASSRSPTTAPAGVFPRPGTRRCCAC
jgi:nicotinic acid phosphoribosyltransferase